MLCCRSCIKTIWLFLYPCHPINNWVNFFAIFCFLHDLNEIFITFNPRTTTPVTIKVFSNHVLAALKNNPLLFDFNVGSVTATHHFCQTFFSVSIIRWEAKRIPLASFYIMLLFLISRCLVFSILYFLSILLYLYLILMYLRECQERYSE